jgi:hypothetical protein
MDDKGMDDRGMDDRGMDDRGMDDKGMDDRGMTEGFVGSHAGFIDVCILNDRLAKLIMRKSGPPLSAARPLNMQGSIVLNRRKRR